MRSLNCSTVSYSLDSRRWDEVHKWKTSYMFQKCILWSCFNTWTFSQAAGFKSNCDSVVLTSWNNMVIVYLCNHSCPSWKTKHTWYLHILHAQQQSQWTLGHLLTKDSFCLCLCVCKALLLYQRRMDKSKNKLILYEGYLINWEVMLCACCIRNFLWQSWKYMFDRRANWCKILYSNFHTNTCCGTLLTAWHTSVACWKNKTSVRNLNKGPCNYFRHLRY